MGWLSGWFRRKADESAADRDAAPRDLQIPLSGEAPPRVPDRRATVAGASGTTPVPAPQAGAAAAAVGGAVLLGAEMLHSLSHDAAASTDPAAPAGHDAASGGDGHGGPTEAAAPVPAPASETAAASGHPQDTDAPAADADGDGDAGAGSGDDGGGDGGDGGGA